MSGTATVSAPTSQSAWRRALEQLPSTPDDIPSFFFAHGSPLLVAPDPDMRGPLEPFLRDFGPALLEKYRPKGIVVFSAHWETTGEILVTDYGEDNPLLMDYYGFPADLYQLKFKSRGDTVLANRIVQLFEEAGQQARLSPRTESRGMDGRGYPGPGLDHGVFIPFRIMFGDEFMDVPIVEVSLDGSLDPEKNWALGKAVTKLRQEGNLILSGGLTVHNFQDRASWAFSTANQLQKDFHDALLGAVSHEAAETRKQALVDLTQHAGFRSCHPREEHFIPVYVAAGAGEDGKPRVVCGLYGAPTFAFGVH